MSKIASWQWMLVLLMAVSQATSAQTLRIEYYQWTKTYYKGGKVKTEDGKSGQFITRTKKVCYDSDQEGCTVNNGSLTLVNQQGNTSKYTGPSYYGTPTSYTFYDDKGILNIQDRDGNVYVYKRTTAPSGRKTSSLIASKRSSGSGGGSSGSAVYIPPVSTGSSSSSGSSHTKTRKTCAVCNGTGRVVKGSMASIGKYKKYCSECGREVDSSHYHGMCTGCNGRGYTEY